MTTAESIAAIVNGTALGTPVCDRCDREAAYAVYRHDDLIGQLCETVGSCAVTMLAPVRGVYPWADAVGA